MTKYVYHGKLWPLENKYDQKKFVRHDKAFIA